MSPRRRDGDLLASVRSGVIVAAVLFAIAAVLTVAVATETQEPPVLGTIDRWWRDVVQPSPGWLGGVSEWLYALGSGWVMVPLRLAVAVWLGVRKRRIDLAAWLIGWAAADLITLALKPTIARSRPDLRDVASFPSGHVKSAAQMAIGLVLLLPIGRRAWAWVGAFTWIVAMALSRMILDEHWLSDTVAGASYGAACAIGAAAACQAWRDRHRAAQPSLASP